MSVPKNSKKIILDLCGGTGSWSKPYADAGYDVRVVTLPDDIRLLKPSSCYGVLAAPPCTHLCGSGARWWKAKGKVALLESLSVVDACMRFVLLGEPVFWVLENPVGRLVHYIGKPVMYYNPCDYGDAYTKKTCLWGDFHIPERQPVSPVPQNKNPIWNMSPGDNRNRLRSTTPPGFAKAFFRANQ